MEISAKRKNAKYEFSYGPSSTSLNKSFHFAELLFYAWCGKNNINSFTFQLRAPWGLVHSSRVSEIKPKWWLERLWDREDRVTNSFS